jgi:hypothetical protein
MLDTNAFDRVADGNIRADALRGRRLVVTHVQLDEIRAITNEKRRASLLALFSEIGAEMVPTSTGIFGDSHFGQPEWSAEDGVYEAMLARLQELDKAAGKRPRGFNQSRDVRIAETALRRDCTRVTGDSSLATVVRERGGRPIRPEDLAAEPRFDKSLS